jgi:hypothetical protein
MRLMASTRLLSSSADVALLHALQYWVLAFFGGKLGNHFIHGVLLSLG